MGRIRMAGITALVISAALTGGEAEASTLTLEATDDAYVTNSQPDHNFGQTGLFLDQRGEANIAASFLRFDLSGVSVPLYQITGLTLRLTGGNHALNLYRFDVDAWSEGAGDASGTLNPSGGPTAGITWNNFAVPFLEQLDAGDLLATATPWALGPSFSFLPSAISPDFTDGALTVAVTFPAFPGSSPPPDYATYESSENAASSPKLDIHYDPTIAPPGPVPEAASLTLGALGAAALARSRGARGFAGTSTAPGARGSRTALTRSRGS